MMELPLVALAGVLGSSHCVGMCGGFAVSIGAGAATWRMNLLRQFAYGIGRIFTYAALGAVAAYGGRRLVQSTPIVHAQAVLALATGVLLICHGAYSVGFFRWLNERWRRYRAATGKRSASSSMKHANAAALPCLQRGMLRTLLSLPGLTSPMLAGVLTGFLPCGLVYTMLLLAVTADGPLGGGVLMACFGLGTLPVMTALGLGTSVIGLAARQRVLRAAAIAVMVTGGLSVARGAAAWNSTAQSPESRAPACPLCKTGE